MSFYIASGFKEAVIERVKGLALEDIKSGDVVLDFDFDDEVVITVGYYSMTSYQVVLDEVSLTTFNDWMQA